MEKNAFKSDVKECELPTERKTQFQSNSSDDKEMQGDYYDLYEDDRL
ncbi:hypothetical protein [Anoxybacteroides tepidamans]|nr:hypothetical protein [Anoxybacillus tepidamans]